MDMGKIGANIIKAFQVLAIIVGVVGAVFLGLFILALILGIIFGIVLDGSISVDTSTNDTLTMIQGNFTTVVGQITTGAQVAGSLIVVAVVLLVFGGIFAFGYSKYQSYKKGKGGSGGY